MAVSAINNFHLVTRLAVALAIGLLIGLERGWEERELAEGQRAAGFRTFGIIGLLGGVATAVGGGAAGGLLAVFGAAVALFVALGYWRERWREQDVSVTGLVAALLTFGLGALAGEGEMTAASSTAVVVTLLLGFKPELHQIIRRIERPELLATLRLLLISVVLLPVLPDRGFGPWQAFNPYRIWLMVVMVALISYVGYFAIKMLGERRGVLLAGLCGGLVSSTAVTVSLARHARDEPGAPGLLTAGVAAASAVMFPRMLLIVGMVWLPLAGALALPLLSAAVLTFAAAAWFSARARVETHSAVASERELSNPLDLKLALQFGAFLALVMFLARGADIWMGSQGLNVLAAFAGLADVDAMSLSCAAMARQGQLTLQAAAQATLIAAAVNTLIKPLIVLALGDLRMGWRVGLTMAGAFLGGGAGLWALVR